MNKSMIVALWDIKNALTVRLVKYGLAMAAAFGPALNIIMVLGLALVTPVDVMTELMGFLFPMVASMLAIFALIPTTMISANALVGEREQNTLEPLLCTPLTDKQLLWGKTLSSAIPSLIVLVASVAITMIGVNIGLLAIGYPLMLIPDIPGLFLLFTAVPITIFALVAVMILISGRVTRVYEAYQTTSAVVIVFILPMMMPLFSIDETGMTDQSLVWLTNIITLLIAVAIFAVAWALALSRFNRDKLVSLV
ncbi:MAG: ABC transporter permease subunit [Candidatus Thorarchaeota archaeon]